MEQPHDLPFSFKYPTGDKVHEGTVVFMRPLQQADVFLPENRGNDGHHVPVLYERGVHEQA